NLLGTQITLNPAFRFIAEILDTQVHYTGLGSNTDKIGFLITSAVGALADNAKNIIKVDDVGFIGQDYAIDLSEVDVSNLRLSFGNNSYQSIGVGIVKEPLQGNYSELPFTNHVMGVPSVDVVVDTLKQSISLHEGVGGNVINVYAINELQSVLKANSVDIIQRSSNKIQLRDCTFGNIYVNGVQAGNDLNSANDTLNAAFGMDLVDYKSFLVSEVGINGDESEGGTLPVQADAWYYSYGADAGNPVGGPTVSLYDAQRMPFYNGNALEQGHEFIFTADSPADIILGKWSGTEASTNHATAKLPINWETGIRFGVNNSKVYAVAGTDYDTRYPDKYDYTNQTVIAVRYGTDKHIYWIDVTGGANVVIAKSNIPQTTETFMLQMYGHYTATAAYSAKLPIMQERTQTWTFVADEDSSEDNEWADGIEDNSVIKSNMSISPGQKITLNLSYQGSNEGFGIGYTGTSTGQGGARNLIDSCMIYSTGEKLNAYTDAEWTFNTGASLYDSANGGMYGVTNLGVGLVSLKYTDNNIIKLFSESNNELIATLVGPLDGSPVHVYVGASGGGTNNIPDLVKFDLADDSDPASAISEWWYIESPDGTFFYPLFKTEAEANAIDIKEGGSGTSHTHT
ncbi:MAG: hypothetical protein P8P29_08595, partial [Flavobacteriaceae bacterium]|nr:hypothetical protein [Flavobacteriaceae bacterium]